MRRGIHSAGGYHACLMAALFGLASSGCGPSTSSEIPEGAATTRPETPSTSGRAQTTTSAVDADVEVVEAYVAYWEARLEANSPPDPASSALRMTATGAQLDQVIAETQSNRENGLEFRAGSNPPRRHVSVSERSDNTATVQECVVDDSQVVRSGTGELVDDNVATHSVEATLSRVDGRWKVAAIHLIQRWEGVAGCALTFGL